MKKAIYLFFMGILSVSLAGCVTAKKVVRERVDQDISGNQGCLQGTAQAPTAERPTTREYIDIKVELPTWGEIKERLPKKKQKKAKRVRAEDKAVSGNKGYFMSSRGFEEELTTVTKRAEPVYGEEVIVGPEVVEEPEAVSAYQEYTVKEGDTLSHIAKAFYGKASKWTVIYEANSDKIKDPASVKPGIVLIIPDLETVESEYIK